MRHLYHDGDLKESLPRTRGRRAGAGKSKGSEGFARGCADPDKFDTLTNGMSDSVPPTERIERIERIGPHDVEYREDGLLKVRYHGRITGPDMTALMVYFEELARQVGPVYILLDSNDTIGPDEAARRAMTDFGYASIAAFARFQRGAHVIPTVALTTLLQNAARLKGKPTTRAAVFETEAEARAWLMQLRDSDRDRGDDARDAPLPAPRSL